MLWLWNINLQYDNLHQPRGMQNEQFDTWNSVLCFDDLSAWDVNAHSYMYVIQGIEPTVQRMAWWFCLIQSTPPCFTSNKMDDTTVEHFW